MFQFAGIERIDVDTVSPARRMPNTATGHCSRFGIITATRSPFQAELVLQIRGKITRQLVQLTVGG